MTAPMIPPMGEDDQLAQITAREDLEWAVQRVAKMAAIALVNASRLGRKILKGFGYPDEVFSDAQDARALATVLDALTLTRQQHAEIDCPLCGETVKQAASATLSLALWQHVNWVCSKPKQHADTELALTRAVQGNALAMTNALTRHAEQIAEKDKEIKRLQRELRKARELYEANHG